MSFKKKLGVYHCHFAIGHQSHTKDYHHWQPRLGYTAIKPLLLGTRFFLPNQQALSCRGRAPKFTAFSSPDTYPLRVKTKLRRQHQPFLLPHLHLLFLRDLSLLANLFWCIFLLDVVFGLKFGLRCGHLSKHEILDLHILS